MKNITGPEAASRRGLRNGSKRLLYVAVSAVALLMLLYVPLGSDDSSAEPDQLRFHPGLYHENGDPFTGPIMDNPQINFNTVTRQDGLYFEMIPGQSLDRVPAFFAVSSDNEADRGKFMVTVAMEGLEGTWMDYYEGVRVSAGNGFTAELSKTNHYEAVFFADEKAASFDMDTPYRITIETLGGSQSSVNPGPIGNITIRFDVELIPDYCTVQFIASTRDIFSNVVEERILYDTDKLGTLPTISVEGYTFEGWEDSEGNAVTADTYVYELPYSARNYEIKAKLIQDDVWPKIVEWDDDPVTNPDGSVTNVHHKMTQYQDGSYDDEITSSTVYPQGDTKTEEDQKRYDPTGDETTTRETTTETTKHEDGSETQTIDDKVTDKTDGSSVETRSTTEYDPNGVMTSEEKEIKVTDSDRNTKEYEVEATLVDDKETKYKVEVGVPDFDQEDFDRAEEEFDSYDSVIRVIGKNSEDGKVTVPEEKVSEISDKGWGLFIGDGTNRIEFGNGTVRELKEMGGDILGEFMKDASVSLTPAQKEAVKEDTILVTASLLAGDTGITELSENATIDVYTGFEPASVYSLSEDGSKEYLEMICDGAPDTKCVYDFNANTLTVYDLKIGTERVYDLNTDPVSVYNLKTGMLTIYGVNSLSSSMSSYSSIFGADRPTEENEPEDYTFRWIIVACTAGLYILPVMLAYAVIRRQRRRDRRRGAI